MHILMPRILSSLSILHMEYAVVRTTGLNGFRAYLHFTWQEKIGGF